MKVLNVRKKRPIFTNPQDRCREVSCVFLEILKVGVLNCVVNLSDQLKGDILRNPRNHGEVAGVGLKQRLTFGLGAC